MIPERIILVSRGITVFCNSENNSLKLSAKVLTFYLGIWDFILFRCEQTFVSGLLVRTNSDESSGATDNQADRSATVTFSSCLARR